MGRYICFAAFRFCIIFILHLLTVNILFICPTAIAQRGTDHHNSCVLPFQRNGCSKFSKVAVGRHLGFGPTGSSAIRSADLENPTLEPNMKRIG